MFITPIFPVPYYAVIFSSTYHQLDNEYEGLDEILMQKAKELGGFLGMDSARSEFGISISYWESMEAILAWKKHLDHIDAMNKGKEKWYEYFNVRVCKVERNYEFQREAESESKIIF